MKHLADAIIAVAAIAAFLAVLFSVAFFTVGLWMWGLAGFANWMAG